jgi:Tol biopolymer transport system component
VPRPEVAIVVVAFLTAFSSTCIGQDSLIVPGEKPFARLRRLTFGGQNAEGYFCFDESRLMFQSTRDAFQCDQICAMDLWTGKTRLLSRGKGRATWRSRGGRNFDLYVIGVDGSRLERITYNGTFDGFPVFTGDGKRLVFASKGKSTSRD